MQYTADMRSGGEAKKNTRLLVPASKTGSVLTFKRSPDACNSYLLNVFHEIYITLAFFDDAMTFSGDVSAFILNAVRFEVILKVCAMFVNIFL